MQFSTCTRIQSTNMPSNRAIISFTQHPHSLCSVFFSIIERSELMALVFRVFYYKDMVEKVTMQRTQQFSAFVSYRKNPTQRQNDCACSAIFACEFVSSVRMDPFMERMKHLFLRILSHQWTEISFIIYKDIGTSTEMLQE